MTVSVIASVTVINWSVSTVLISMDGTKTIVLSTGRNEQDTFEGIKLGAHGERHNVLECEQFEKSKFVLCPYYVSLYN